jgi:hypothetical protein
MCGAVLRPALWATNWWVRKVVALPDRNEPEIKTT